MNAAKFLDSLGLHRKELRAWALYDWANSGFFTVVVAAVLPIYYADVAAAHLEDHQRSAYWGYTVALAMLIVAIIAPVMGAMADFLGEKKKFVFYFMMMGATGSAGLFFVGEGDWLLASVMYTFAMVGFAGGNVFYEALLPHIASRSEVDRVSTAGYAIGYLGGGVLLAINLAWIMLPDTFGFADKGAAVRASFISVAIWWIVFAIPLFRFVREPETDKSKTLGDHHPVRAAFSQLLRTAKQIRHYKYVLIFLVAYWLYMDGIGTIMKMATIFGREIGIESTHLIGALLLVQFVGIPFTFAFGAVASRIGPKAGIMISVLVYAFICILGYFMNSAIHFWLLACMVAMVQGGCQALSRSLYASIIPKKQSAEFFGFFSVSSRFAGIFGPLFFAVLAQVFGESRMSILLLIVFFIVGLLVLSKLDVNEARRVVESE